MSPENQILQKMTELLDSPTKWTKYQLARNAAAFAVDPEDGRAVCWCLVGASECFLDSNVSVQTICRTRDKIREAIKGLFPERVSEQDHVRLPEFNDHPQTTYTDIIKVLDLAKTL